MGWHVDESHPIYTYILTPSGAVHAVTRVHLISVNQPITAVDYNN